MKSEYKEVITRVCEVKLSYHPKVKPCERPVVRSSEDAYQLFLQKWNIDTIHLKEEIKIMMLNRAAQVVYIDHHSTGSMTSTYADPKMIVLTALCSIGCRLVLAHNHPTGTLIPSRDDRELTEKIKQGLRLYDMRLDDHLIISADGYFSFADQGLL